VTNFLRYVTLITMAALSLGASSAEGPDQEKAKQPEHKIETPNESSNQVALAEHKSSDGSCIADSAAIEDLQMRRQEIETKLKEIAAKEAELKARETAVADELKKIQGIRDDIKKTNVLKTKENDEKVSKLVETFETMSPKAAAEMLATMDESLAVAAVGRITTQRLAKIMNLMKSGDSTRLSESLVGVARTNESKTTSVDVAAAAEKKGGPQNVESNKQ
jgi:flagellar motility protein MotE (MotC chaperone)